MSARWCAEGADAPILLLGDITGRSSVAVRMLTSVLEAAGHEVFALPTALISNTLNLGKTAQLDTTDYLLRSLAVWREIGVEYGCMYIGYITGLAQAKALAAVADDARVRGIPVLLDPILGDGGKRYHSVTEEQVQGMRLLARHADLITPNLTEACLLTDTQYAAAIAEPQRIADMAAKLAENSGAALITSGLDDAGRDAVVGCARGEAPFAVPFMRVPGQFGGTGDRFTALLLDGLVRGYTLEQAAAKASRGVYRALCDAQKQSI